MSDTVPELAVFRIQIIPLALATPHNPDNIRCFAAKLDSVILNVCKCHITFFDDNFELFL
jgi:hypothetical protein